MSLGRRVLLRGGFAGLAAALVLVLSGDRGALTAAPGGIDPLEILKLQIKPNVFIILDTSGSMMEPGSNILPLGGDDFSGKMHQAKKALNTVVSANKARVNFGLGSYFAENDDKFLPNSTFDGRSGVLTYVTNQVGGDTWTGGAAPDFFRTTRSTTASNYDGANGADVYESLQSINRILTQDTAGGACTAEPCRRVLRSRFLRNNVRFRWNTTTNPPPLSSGFVSDTVLLGTTSASDPVSGAAGCPLPPAALFPDDPDKNLPDADGDGVGDPDGFSDIARPCMQHEDSAGSVTTFWYTSGTWNSSVSNCTGARLLASVASCAADNTPAILSRFKDELPIDGSCGNPVGIPCGITPVTSTSAAPYPTLANTNPATTAGLDPNTVLGVLSAGSTPLGASLDYVYNNFAAVFPSTIPGQQNFVVLLTDGVETCGGNAEAAADRLFNPTNGNPSVYTFVIGLSINTGTLDLIARAGSGGARDAIPAANADELIAALQAVLDTAISTGAFSAANQVVGSVFELIQDLAVTPELEDPLDPTTRYNQRVNIIYQSTFGLPGWQGHLFAFLNDGTLQPVPNVNFSGNWDAAETLFEQVSSVLEENVRGSGRQVNQFTFFELHNGATVDGIQNEDPTANGALIKRRAFTSNGNGTFARSGSPDVQFDASSPQGRNVVALWPPNQTGLDSGIAEIDPPIGTVGPLDDALGIGPGSNPVLSFTDLQTQLLACTSAGPFTDPDTGAAVPATPLPPECDAVANPTLALDAARKEARQILLAWIAGARVDNRSGDGKPVRALDVPGLPILYRDRGWLLLDSTFTTPAVIGPPLGEDPSGHVPEYVLYRDGRRDTEGLGIAENHLGFGLANPDKDDPVAQARTNLELKPVMTVVYQAANDGVHAFQALTSEELWSFVPYDQLGKIQDMINPGQLRDPHVYMVASSLRFAEVFVPDVDGYSFGASPFSFTGRWRRMLVFGRGKGGKFYTALDVTSPGPYTHAALDTNPPWVMWSRGNPDAAQPAEFARMGETWSVPAVGDVSGKSDAWRVFTGSGYGDLPGEGATFYMLDAITGDALLAQDVGDGTRTFVPENALVAGPAAYNPFSLDPPGVTLRSTIRQVTRVFIPDLHGRVWAFSTTSGALFADVGPTQPIADGPALLKLGDKPHVFFGSGNDTRVPDGLNPPFRMYGYRDDGGVAGVQLFTIDYPTGPPSDFRNVARPATGYTSAGEGLVLYVGSRFVPAGADCLSSFDTILFGVISDPGAAGGYSAGYDFSGDGVADLSYVIQGQKAGGVSTTGGSVTVSLSGSRSGPPPAGGGAGVSFPGPPPTPPPGPPPPPNVVPTKIATGSPVCRNF
ncbi:MAG: hypothetical protein HY317_02110 [Acidobacteria bacterium]|nr:hypothetical protein [Acidobacteriota bacterium]